MYAARAVAWGFDLGAEAGLRLLWQHYNPRCQPPWSEKELRHKCEEADTVPFGKSRGWLLEGRPYQGGGGAASASPARFSPMPGPAQSSVAAVEQPHLTDKGNCLRLAAWHGADLRHVGAWKKWQAWDGTRWITDTTSEVDRRAKQVPARILAEANQGMEEIRNEMEERANG
jgi:putative DNA primase/helicase